MAETVGGFLGRAGVVLFGWLPCWKSSSACLPGKAEQAARCPLAVCGFQDLLTLPAPEASPSLDSFLIRVMDMKTEGDITGRGMGEWGVAGGLGGGMILLYHSFSCLL